MLKVYFHRPISWLGSNLSTSSSQIKFKQLKKNIKDYVQTTTMAQKELLFIIDSVDLLGCDITAMDILIEIVEYIRICILSRYPMVVVNAVTLSDALIKNCGTKIHILMGTKLFLKTLSVIARRWIKHNSNVSATILDAIQGWGEGFEVVRKIFPNYEKVYLHLKNKPYIHFPRQQYDKTRVPIFLGELTAKEKVLIDRYQDDDNEDDFELNDDDTSLDGEYSCHTSSIAVEDNDLLGLHDEFSSSRKLPHYLELCRNAQSMVEVIPPEVLEPSKAIGDEFAKSTKIESIFDVEDLSSPALNAPLPPTQPAVNSLGNNNATYIYSKVPYSKIFKDEIDAYIASPLSNIPPSGLFIDKNGFIEYNMPKPPPPPPRRIIVPKNNDRENYSQNAACDFQNENENEINSNIIRTESQPRHRSNSSSNSNFLPSSDPKNNITYFGEKSRPPSGSRQSSRRNYNTGEYKIITSK